MKYLTNYKVCIALCFALLTFSISIASPVKDIVAYKNASTKSFTAEEVFKGVFFGKGEIAKKMPELNKMFVESMYGLNKSQKLEVSQKQEELFSLIKKYKPSVITNFKIAVDSKDPYKIEASLNNTALDISKIPNVSSILGPLSIKDKKFSGKPGEIDVDGIATYTYNYNVNQHIDTEIAAVKWVAIALLILILLIIPASSQVKSTFVTDMAKTNLQKEMVVNSIVGL